MTRARRIALALLVGTAACGGPRTGDVLPPAAHGTASFGEASAVFALSCATQGCHAGNPPATAPDSFDPGAAYAALVGQPAIQVPAMALVAPGDPDRSYVVLKLRGTASTVGGVATRMPLNAHPLSAEDEAAIEGWIAAGAPHE